MNMIGDMGRYTQFQVAESMPIAAANEGGLAGAGAGLGAGFVMAQQMANAMRPPSQGGPAPDNPTPPVAPVPGGGGAAPAGPAAPSGEVKFCMECGKQIPKKAKFCPECGGKQD
jgi:membrane protease subunit (stomatin/prohibitin family)